MKDIATTLCADVYPGALFDLLCRLEVAEKITVADIPQIEKELETRIKDFGAIVISPMKFRLIGRIAEVECECSQVYDSKTDQYRRAFYVIKSGGEYLLAAGWC